MGAQSSSSSSAVAVQPNSNSQAPRTDRPRSRSQSSNSSGAAARGSRTPPEQALLRSSPGGHLQPGPSTFIMHITEDLSGTPNSPQDSGSPFLEPASSTATSPILAAAEAPSPVPPAAALLKDIPWDRACSPVLVPSPSPEMLIGKSDSVPRLTLPALLSSEGSEVHIDGGSVSLRSADGRRYTVFKGGAESAAQQLQTLQEICSAAQQVAAQTYGARPLNDVCCICFEEQPSEAGLSCGLHDAHFVCDACLDRYVIAECSPDADGTAAASDGTLACPGRQLEGGQRCSASYDSQAIARHVTSEAFQAYWAYRNRLAEARIAAEMEDALHAKAEAEAKRDEASRQRILIGEMMTLKCPRCGQAFQDFEHCFAVRCSRPTCQTNFCGWCLVDCGADAHHHINHQCAVAKMFNPKTPVWGTPEQFEAAHRLRRQNLLQAQLKQFESSLLREVLEALGPDLKAWGLQVRVEQTPRLPGQGQAEPKPKISVKSLPVEAVKDSRIGVYHPQPRNPAVGRVLAAPQQAAAHPAPQPGGAAAAQQAAQAQQVAAQRRHPNVVAAARQQPVQQVNRAVNAGGVGVVAPAPALPRRGVAAAAAAAAPAPAAAAGVAAVAKGAAPAPAAPAPKAAAGRGGSLVIPGHVRSPSQVLGGGVVVRGPSFRQQ